MMLELEGVHVEAAGRVLVRGLSARVAAGEVLALTGPSGSGKSSLLTWLAGVAPDGVTGGGIVRVDGVAVQDQPALRRRIGLLFQDDLLFAHMTVFENLLFAVPTGPRAARHAAARAALAGAGLADRAGARPQTLSGGQRSRVALLRALLAQPRALLLDEPFSRLDAALRRQFRAQVFAQLRAAGVPALLVTHDEDDIPAGAARVRLEVRDA